MLYGSAPRGPLGVKRCARVHETCHLRFGALTFPPIEEYSKYSKKTRLFAFFFNFDDFSKFVPFGGNLSAKTQQSKF